MITKSEALQLVSDYHTWEYWKDQLVIRLDSDIRTAATNGGIESYTDLTIFANMPERSISEAMAVLNNNGFNEIDVDDQKQWIKVRWSDNEILLSN